MKYKLDPFDLKVEENKPVEYITGFAEFYDRDFIVNENVLIPRIETEKMIKLGVDFVKEKVQSKNPKKKKRNISIVFADIGTGSGAIGISFAKELEKLNQNYFGILSDISGPALDVAKKNLRSLKLTNSKIKLVESNLFSNINRKVKFDIIFANLPYIPTKRMSQLQSSVKDFEPYNALDGGEHGLDIIKRILIDSREYLKKDGIMILEVDDSHGENIIKNNGMKKYFKFWDVEVLKDLNSKIRFWRCSRN
jgi:release factor glutamine methyltransferase